MIFWIHFLYGKLSSANTWPLSLHETTSYNYGCAQFFWKPLKSDLSIIVIKKSERLTESFILISHICHRSPEHNFHQLHNFFYPNHKIFLRIFEKIIYRNIVQSKILIEVWKVYELINLIFNLCNIHTLNKNVLFRKKGWDMIYVFLLINHI